MRSAVQTALTGRRRVHLRYLVPSRDETTERDVDPMRLFTAEGHSYLEGWCHRADDVRLFRLDRVVDVEVLDVAGASLPSRPARVTCRPGSSSRVTTTSRRFSTCRRPPAG